MNSLFAKILLWFWATLVITTIGSAFISGLSGPRPYLVSRLVAFQLEEARTAYETGGQAGLRAVHAPLPLVFVGDGILDRQHPDTTCSPARMNPTCSASRARSPAFRPSACAA